MSKTALITTSADLHNENCCKYLNALTIPSSVSELLKRLSPVLKDYIDIASKPYNRTYSYANTYTELFRVFETNLNIILEELQVKQTRLESEIKRDRFVLKTPEDQETQDRRNIRQRLAINQMSLNVIKKKQSELDDFIFSMYDNENDILEDTYQKIKSVALQARPTRSIQDAIKKHTRDPLWTPHKETPAQAGSTFGRFGAMVLPDFKPQHTTSLSTIRSYMYQTALVIRKQVCPKEYRFGTQGQRHNTNARVSPLFKYWLTIQARRTEQTPSAPTISHIYFNNLGLDRYKGILDFYEGSKERGLSLALHTLETDHPNVAVITLPADQGLMSQALIKETTPSLSYDAVKTSFLRIATQQTSEQEKKAQPNDFYISDKIRDRLFTPNPDNTHPSDEEQKTIEQLVTQSFETLGIQPGSRISPAQKQAVWFHFIKFELTDYILQKLQPESINFSCKDAIDRGGVSSLYYNLMKSIQVGLPLTRDEFERGLHAAPTMVKGRGMNHHIKLIWNVIDATLAHSKETLDAPTKRWMMAWRDMNCPKERVLELLHRRMIELENVLKTTPMPMREKAQAILEEVTIHLSSSRINSAELLEVVSRTESLIRPSEPLEDRTDELNQYDALCKHLEPKFPGLTFLGELLSNMVRSFLGLPSINNSKLRDTMKHFHAETPPALVFTDRSSSEELDPNEKTSPSPRTQ